MKVANCVNFNKEYPEFFTWGHVENVDLSNIGNDLARYIEHYQHDGKRIGTEIAIAALRLALNIVAERAEI